MEVLLMRDCFSQQEAADVLGQLEDCSLIYLNGSTLAALGGQGLGDLLPRLIEARTHGALLVIDNHWRPRLWRERRHAADTYSRLLPHVKLT
jgi:2-dehydro-3-deoxygluconokinase